MNLLLVECDQNHVDRFLTDVGQVDRISIAIANTKEEAINHCSSNLVDVFVLGIASTAVENAVIPQDDVLELFREIQNCAAPNTPVFFWAQADLSVQAVDKILQVSNQADICGDNYPIPTSRIFRRDNLQEMLLLLADLEASFRAVDEIQIDSSGRSLSLKPEQKRIIRSFVRKFGGASCGVRQFDGGLSGSRVLELKVEDLQGATKMKAVGKLDVHDKISIELSNYENQVSRLPARGYAPLVGVVKGSSADSAGVFYRLLGENDKPLFNLVAENQAEAANAVRYLHGLLSAWHGNAPRSIQTIESIRRQQVSDEVLSELVEKHDLGWIQDIERVEVRSRTSSVHGDLHGGNVYVGENSQPMTIDFGDVFEGASVVDPITLELSMFCHPSMRESISWLPDFENPQWSDLDQYLVDCPYSDYIRACRIWSHDVSGGDQDVNAGAYSYLIKQLKYGDVDSELVLALLSSIKKTILNPN